MHPVLLPLICQPCNFIIPVMLKGKMGQSFFCLQAGPKNSSVCKAITPQQPQENHKKKKNVSELISEYSVFATGATMVFVLK